MSAKRRKRFRRRVSLSGTEILSLMSMGKWIEYFFWGEERNIRYRLGKVWLDKAVVLSLVDQGKLRGVDFGEYGYLILRDRLDKPKPIPPAAPAAPEVLV